MSSKVLSWAKRIIEKILRLFLIFPVFLINRNQRNEKPIIVLMDRRNEAGDNAEAMYHYFKDQTDCEAYFVLDHNSEDWHRLQPDNHVIDIRSVHYAWLYLHADWFMFSHTLHHPRGFRGLSDIIRGKKVFLQHGVIHEDLSRIYNASKDHDFVCVATKPEYIDRHNPSYGYKPEQILLTGLPRFDCLKKKPEKIITIGLTWRKYLRNASSEEIQSSTYFSMIRELIFMPKLTDLAEKFGYGVQFVPHPELGENIVTLVEGNKDKRITITTKKKYSEIISETALMITDYSSLAFDVAYLKIPVIYYQKDEEEFYSGKHSYAKGYFEFQRDGFGEVVYNVDNLLEVVESYLKQDCKMKSIYEDRVQNTFEYFDSKNCERVYRALMQKT